MRKGKQDYHSRRSRTHIEEKEFAIGILPIKTGEDTCHYLIYLKASIIHRGLPNERFIFF